MSNSLSSEICNSAASHRGYVSFNNENRPGNFNQQGIIEHTEETGLQSRGGIKRITFYYYLTAISLTLLSLAICNAIWAISQRLGIWAVTVKLI